jgi:Lipoprotein LpqB beta-propeller domain/Sporulation and spore germination
MSRQLLHRAQRWLVIALLTPLVVLAGCVSVPTVAPLEKVQGQQPSCQNCVNVEVAAPAPGDDARHIVEGYLRATSNYQPNYSIAKRFLTKAAADKWSPEAGASIYRGALTTDGDRVSLDGLLIGVLDGNRSYTAKGTTLHVDFGLVKEDGEWRIGKPPHGLLVAAYSFNRFYQPYSLYFIGTDSVGNGSSLVPDPIYLPNLRSQSNIASVLVKALLNGQSPWLKPASASAIPPTTALSGDAVTIDNGIATVPLNDPVLQLNDQQRQLMAAQVIYTLREAVGIQGVLFTVNQQPLRVPGGDDTTFIVSADSVPKELDPIPFVAGDQLYGVRKGAVQIVTAGGTEPKVVGMTGALGHGRYPVDSLAVTTANTDLALVTDHRTALRRSPTARSDVTTLVRGARDLLRPQFSRYGELWAVGRRNGRQQMWMYTAAGKVNMSTPGLFDKGEITAFKLSPDSTRMALIRRGEGDIDQLGLARISRRGRVTVDGWRTLNTTQADLPQLRRIQDVSWVDATDLMVLGAPSPIAALQPFRVSQDASRITGEGESTNWDPVGLTVLLRSQAAVVIGRNGQTYRDEGSQWTPFVDKLSTIAYPG